MIGDIIEIERAKHALGDIPAATVSAVADSGVSAAPESAAVERPALLGPHRLEPLRALLSLAWGRSPGV